MRQAEVRVWDPFIRIFHWLLVLCFTVAWLTGEELQGLHVDAGYAVVALVMLRVLWGFIGPRHARFSDFVSRPVVVSAYLRDTLKLGGRRYLGHNPAGGAMIVLMLLSLLLVSVSGFAIYAVEEDAGPLAVLAGLPQSQEHLLEEVHEVLASLMVLLVVIHVAGVFVESWVHRESLVKAMLTGRKRA